MGTFEIAIYVLIGLGTILAFVTYRLLSEDKKRNKRDVRKINAIYVYIIFFMVICQVAILDHFSNNSKITVTNMDGRSISVANRKIILPWDEFFHEDTTQFYYSKEDGFSFRLPEGIRPEIERVHGFDAYLKGVNFETSPENMDAFLSFSRMKMALGCLVSDYQERPYEEALTCFRESTGISKFGSILKKSVSTKWEVAAPIKIGLEPRSRPMLANIFLLTDSNATDSSANSLSLSFIPYFGVTVFERSENETTDPAFSLANYFISTAANLIYDVEKLVADENNILMASKLQLKHVHFGSKTTTLDIHRWMELVQQENKVYLIEIAYSPQLDPRGMIWDDLKQAFESFKCYH